ncbi:MAG: M50 family metallopeptidase [Patescibacteria group bacterium]
MNMLIVILVLAFLVLIHELGHYLAARFIGIRVREFGFGYPPRALKLGTWKKTLFSLNWLPFGGFVRLAGDDAESLEGAGEKDEDGSVIPKQELFAEKPPVKRLVVVLAGVVVNIVFGIAAFAILYTMFGIPENLPHPLIEIVAQGSPAETAQLKSGDEILLLNNQEVNSAQAFITMLRQFRGEIVTIEVKRDGEVLKLEPYVRTPEETPTDEGGLGVMLNDVKIVQYPPWQMIPKGIARGVQDSYAFAKQILSSLGQLVVTLVQKRSVPNELSGPIGIVYVAQKQDVFKQGPFMVLNFAGLLSLNLGVLNLLPIPALDGGRAVFILLERLLGKERRVRYEQRANAVGMIFLLGLIVLISVKDVLMIVRK